MSRQQNLKVKDEKNRQYCNWCESYFDGQLEFHVNEENHKNNLCFTDWKSEACFVEPFVILRQKRHNKYVYHCLVCDCLMPTDRRYLDRHIKGIGHFKVTETHCSNIFLVQDRQFYCATCDFVIASPQEILSHINDKAHVSSQLQNRKSELSSHATLQSFAYPSVEKQSYQGSHCMIWDAALASENILSDNLKSKNHTKSIECYEKHLIPLENDSRYCQLCSLHFPEAVEARAHQTEPTHVYNSVSQPIDWLAKLDFIAPFVYHFGENYFYCLSCDRPVSGLAALESHTKGAHHMEMLEYEMEHVAPLENGCFACYLCKCIISCSADVYKHLTGVRHLTKLGVTRARQTELKKRPQIADWRSIENSIQPFVLIEGNDQFYCVLCHCSFVGAKTLKSHTLSPLHKLSLEQQSRFIHLLDNGSFHCSLCDQLISNHYRVDSHLRTTKHCSLRSIITAQNNEKYEEKNAKSRDKAPDDAVQNREIQFKSNFAQPTSTKTLRPSEAMKKPDVRSNRFIASRPKSKSHSAARVLEEFDESLLNFQKKNRRNSTDFENSSQSDEAVNSNNFESSVSITGKRQTRQEIEKTESTVHSRNIGSFERPELEDGTGLEKSSTKIKTQERHTPPLETFGESVARRLENLTAMADLSLEDTTSPIDFNGSNSLENDETPDEKQQSNKNSNLANPKTTNIMKNKNSSESIDSGTENLSPLTSTSSISLQNPVSKRRVKKSYLERIASLLDFKEDIYDTSERTMRMKLGLDLRFVIDSTRSYCLVCREIISSEHEIDNYLLHLYNLEHLQHLDEMKESHEETSALFGSCNKLEMALEFIEIIPNDCARCLVCQIEIHEDDPLQHIEDEKHRKAREEILARSQQEHNTTISQIHCDWYKVQKYECVLCSKKFDLEIDFVEHLLDDAEHANQLKVLDNGPNRLIYEFCPLCALIYCISSNVQTNHHNSLSHKWFVRNGPFIVDELPQSTRNLLMSLVNNGTWETINLMQEIEEHCRTSIVTAYGKGTGHDYNSAFGTEAPVKDIQFIKFFNKICPSTLNLVSFLKQWLIECDLFGARQISTIALYWYVILYLQAISILPSITTLNSMKMFCRGLAESERILDVEEKPEFILWEHVVGFFSLYANFDYRYDIACPLLGKVIEKRAFADNLHCLPEEMKSYVFYMNNTESAQPFRIDSVMCLQDPFDLQNNLTKSVSKCDLSRFRIFCSKSLTLLCASVT